MVGFGRGVMRFRGSVRPHTVFVMPPNKDNAIYAFFYSQIEEALTYDWFKEGLISLFKKIEPPPHLFPQ